MAKKIEKYEAEDGTLFDSLDGAEAHELAVRNRREIESIVVGWGTPSDDMKDLVDDIIFSAARLHEALEVFL